MTTPTGFGVIERSLARMIAVLDGRVPESNRTTSSCRLGRRDLAAEAQWIEAHRKVFEARFDALDQVILKMKEEEDGSANG